MDALTEQLNVFKQGDYEAKLGRRVKELNEQKEIIQKLQQEIDNLKTDGKQKDHQVWACLQPHFLCIHTVVSHTNNVTYWK